MAKVLKTAALVVGAVALVASGVGAAASAGLLGAAATTGAVVGGLTAATLTSIGAIAGLGAAALSFAAKAASKTPPVTIAGNQTKFTANIDQGVPRAMGRTAISGFIVHRQTWDWSGSKPPNAFQTFFGVWSHGRSKGTAPVFQVDGGTVDFPNNPDGGYSDTPAGAYRNWMWLRRQLGALSDPALVATGFFNYPAGWSAQHRMSGYSAFAWTVKFDEKGKAYPGGAVPQPRRIDDWGPVYDPRQDSTFPGGSGPCRANDESTYVWDGVDASHPANRNPWLQALTHALGHWNNGKRVMGIGFALASIDVPAYAAAANVADANGWAIGGVYYSTDGKWDALKKMCAAGGGEPLQLGGLLSCYVETPRVSLATITDNDIIAAPTIPGGARIRDRLNGVIPTYRSEDHDWQLVPASKVQVDAYVAADGRSRTRPITWELVQDADQVAELATYAICNSREIEGIVLPLKLRWIGYRVGDAVTVASSVAGMDSQLVTLRRRHLDPTTGAVTFTCRTETAEKHPFALGKTTTPPPTPALQTVDRTELLIPGVSANWSATVDDDPVNHPRPDDGATNSADPTSPFGSSTVGAVQQTLDDIDEAVADVVAANGQITTSLARIQAAARQGSPNLLLNGDFSNGMTGWTLSSAQAFLPNTYPTVGTYATGYTPVSGPKYMFADAPVVPGEGYSWSFEGNRYDGTGANVYAKWCTSAGADIGGPLDRLYPSDGWGKRYASSVYTAPSNAAKLRVVVEVTDAGTHLDTSRHMVQQGAPTDWRDDATQAYTTSRVLTLEGQGAGYAESINTITAQLAGTGASGLKTSIAAVDTKAQAGVDAQAAVGQLSTSVDARFALTTDTPLKQALDAKASSSTVNAAFASRDSALATYQQSVSAALGGKADASITAAALSTLDDRTTAYLKQTATSAGGEAILDLVSDSQTGTVFRVSADRIILDGTVITRNLADNSIIAPDYISATGTFTTTWTTIGSITKSLYGPGSKIEITISGVMSLGNVSGGGTTFGYLQLLRDGATIDVGSVIITRVRNQETPFSLTILLSGLSGTHTWEAQYRATASAYQDAHVVSPALLLIRENKK